MEACRSIFAVATALEVVEELRPLLVLVLEGMELHDLEDWGDGVRRCELLLVSRVVGMLTASFKVVERNKGSDTGGNGRSMVCQVCERVECITKRGTIPKGYEA